MKEVVRPASRSRKLPTRLDKEEERPSPAGQSSVDKCQTQRQRLDSGPVDIWNIVPRQADQDQLESTTTSNSGQSCEGKRTTCTRSALIQDLGDSGGRARVAQEDISDDGSFSDDSDEVPPLI